MRTFLSAIAISAMFGGAANAATLIHSYDLNGSAADAFGGPALVLPNPGGLGTTTYHFGEGEGPSLSNGVNPSTYSIEMRFLFDAVNGFRKILDFKDRTREFGLYTKNGDTHLFGGQDTETEDFVAGAFAHVVVTRDDANGGAFKAYVDGVQKLSFFDDGDLTVFSEPGAIIHFLRNDRFFDEDGSGELDFIRIYDGVLTPGEILDLSDPDASPVSLPAAGPLFGGFLIGLAALSRTRRKGRGAAAA